MFHTDNKPAMGATVRIATRASAVATGEEPLRNYTLTQSVMAFGPPTTVYPSVADQQAIVRSIIDGMSPADAVDGNQAGYGTNPVPVSLNTTPFPDAPPNVVVP